MVQITASTASHMQRKFSKQLMRDFLRKQAGLNFIIQREILKCVLPNISLNL